MRWRVVAVVAVALLVGACSDDEGPGASTSAGGDEAAVRTTWRDYREAILARDGARAAALLDEAVLPFYEKSRRLALTAPEAELRQERVVDQLSVLTMRAKVDVHTLRTAEVRVLLARSIQLGLTGEGAVTRLSIGDIEVTGRTATARMVQDGDVTAARYLFRRRDARWRLDLLPVLDSTEAVVRAQAAREGGVAAYVDRLMAASVGEAAARQAWVPIGEA